MPIVLPVVLVGCLGMAILLLSITRQHYREKMIDKALAEGRNLQLLAVGIREPFNGSYYYCDHGCREIYWQENPQAEPKLVNAKAVANAIKAGDYLDTRKSLDLVSQLKDITVQAFDLFQRFRTDHAMSES